MQTRYRLGVICVATCFVVSAAQAGLVASYGFQGTLDSSIGGAALTADNPLGENSYSTTTLYGQQRQVYNMVGTQGAGNNAGLVLGPPSFLADNSSYSVEILFSQTNSPNTNGYRKIYDNSGQTQDQGLYIDPNSQMYYYDDGGTPTQSIAANTFYNVILTYNGSTQAGNIYVNGALDSSFTGADPAITDNTVPISFFMDDTVTGNREFTDASVGLINMWNTELSASDVANIEANPFATPEPCSMVALGTGIAALVARRRRRASA